MKRTIALSLAAACTLAAAPAARADALADIAASSAVGKWMEKKYPRWDWVANCEPRSSRRWRCAVGGTKGKRVASGRVRATKKASGRYAIKILSLKFS